MNAEIERGRGGEVFFPQQRYRYKMGRSFRYKKVPIFQGWEFALSLFRSLLFGYFKKEQRERIALVALYLKSDLRFALFKRAKSFFLKVLCFLRVGVEEKTSNSFSPFYAKNKRANRSRRSFEKRDESDRLLSLFRLL